MGKLTKKIEKQSNGHDETERRLPPDEQVSLARLDGEIARLKLQLADFELQKVQVIARISQVQQAMHAAGQRIALSHGIDVTNPTERWTLDITAGVFRRTQPAHTAPPG